MIIQTFYSWVIQIQNEIKQKIAYRPKNYFIVNSKSNLKQADNK